MTLRLCIEKQSVVTAMPPAPEALARKSASLELLFPELAVDTALSQISASTVKRLKQGGYCSLTAADWRQIGLALWTGNPLLATDYELLMAFLAWMRQNGNRFAWRTLIEAYLIAYQKGKPGIQEVGEQLMVNVPRWAWAWGQRHRRFLLFDPINGPDAIARYALIDADSVDDALNEAGLGGMLRTSGMAYSILLSALTYVSEVMTNAITLENDTILTQLLNKLLPWCAKENKLTFPTNGYMVAEALLRPWTKQAPPRVVAHRLVKFFTAVFGDPRLVPANWENIDSASVLVMRRWLIEETIRAYLPVAEALSFDSKALRRAFWTGYGKAGYISEAWLAYTTPPKDQIFATGRLLPGKGVERGHVVLLLRIGKAVVADWSHGQRCHVWSVDDPTVPPLYVQNYSASDLIQRYSRNSVIHAGGEGGQWQRTVANLIAKLGGVDLDVRYHLPAGWR